MDAAGDSAGVVIGVDIGTTSTKSVAYTTDGQVVASGGKAYPLLEPFAGHAVQEPDVIVEAVLERSGRPSQAWTAGRLPPCPSVPRCTACWASRPRATRSPTSSTWADTRSSEQARRLRASPGGLELHRRTGTPLHPMSPLPKLVWFREQEPKLFEQVGFWVGIKEYVLLRLCDALVVDHSVASATGLLNLASLEWDAEALHLAGLEAEQLAELVPTTTVLPELTAEAAARTGLPARTPVVVGASDGPLANLGLGAVAPGVAACSIGTSGALRVMVDRPAVDPHGQVFCYALTADRWVVGGAINNGGVVLEWAGGALAPDLGSDAAEELLDLAGSVPAGSGGLLMLPYLLSERAPHWSAIPQGAYVGLSRAHRREHLIRAALEGVCLQLGLVLGSMRAAGLDIHEIRATGGFARSQLWRQMLADALGVAIQFPQGHEGSSFGAALLGMQALGIIDSIDVAADLVRVESTVRPDPSAARDVRVVATRLCRAVLRPHADLHHLAAAGPRPALRPAGRASTRWAGGWDRGRRPEGRSAMNQPTITVVPVAMPEGVNVILGQSHFIKTVEDLYEALVGSSPYLRFGLAFCEASGLRLVRRAGNDPELVALAVRHALDIGAGHSFVVFLREGFPVNVLNQVKSVPEVCRVYCATANPVQVLVAETEQGRGILGVVDGATPLGVESDDDERDRRTLLRDIGYKL